MHLKDVPKAIFNGLRRYTFTTANIYVKECKKYRYTSFPMLWMFECLNNLSYEKRWKKMKGVSTPVLIIPLCHSLKRGSTSGNHYIYISRNLQRGLDYLFPCIKKKQECLRVSIVHQHLTIMISFASCVPTCDWSLKMTNKWPFSREQKSPLTPL